MPYTATSWVNGTTAVSQANMNNLETSFIEAVQSLHFNFVNPFVLTGGTCTIHGGLPKQMDVTACTYFARDAANDSVRSRFVAATFFTTVTASTTYFLDYNADGTTSFATSHSGAANYVPIASVTTDGSGNISVITDVRPIAVSLFPAALGVPAFGGVNMLRINSAGGGAAGIMVWDGTTDPGSNAAEGDLWCKG